MHLLNPFKGDFKRMIGRPNQKNYCFSATNNSRSDLSS